MLSLRTNNNSSSINNNNNSNSRYNNKKKEEEEEWKEIALQHLNVPLNLRFTVLKHKLPAA